MLKVIQQQGQYNKGISYEYHFILYFHFYLLEGCRLTVDLADITSFSCLFDFKQSKTLIRHTQYI